MGFQRDLSLWRVQGEALESFPCGIIEHWGREGTA